MTHSHSQESLTLGQILAAIPAQRSIWCGKDARLGPKILLLPLLQGSVRKDHKKGIPSQEGMTTSTSYAFLKSL